MSKFCQYCGSPLNEGARFCPGCGHPVSQTKQQQPYAQQPPQQGYQYGGQPPYQPPYQQPPQKRWGCGKVALVVFLVLLVVLGVGGYFLYDLVKDKIEETNSMVEETVEKPAATQKSQSTSKLKLKYEMFFDVAIPIPDFGVITKDELESHETARRIRFDKISYKQFIEYCKMLEALPGWEADKADNVAHFPKDYNDRMSARCAGHYHSLYVVVTYYNDKFVADIGEPNFMLYVSK